MFCNVGSGQGMCEKFFTMCNQIRGCIRNVLQCVIRSGDV